MKKKIKVGVIGLGAISPRHIEDSINQIPELELTAVCDIKADLAKKIGTKEGVRYYTKYQDLIDDSNVDLVSVATPNYLHSKISLYAAKSNKHCILEKPVSLNYKEAKKLVKAFEKSRGILFPVLQVRYNPTIRIVKRSVENGSLGKILSSRLSIYWTRPQEYYDTSDWKGSKKLDGGSLLTQAIHYIDSTYYILGKAKSVFAKTETATHKIEIEDMVNAIIDLKGGTRLNFDFTLCTYPKNLECSLTILGTKGTIKIGGLALNKLEHWDVEGVPCPDIPDSLDPNVYADGLYVGSCPNHKSIYENAVNVILRGEESFIKAEDSLESLRIIDAIFESNANRKEVVL